jgi:hypothetical protein
MSQHPVLRAASLRLLTASLVSSACACAEPAPASTAHERTTGGSAPSSGGGDEAPAGDPAEPPPPERVSAVVYLGTADGAHLDVVVTAAGETWTIRGVRADNTRADPVPRMIELTEAERRDYAARIRALDDMPRCEPMGRREGEPLFTLRFRDANGLDVDTTEPCLWLRADPPDEATLAEPCMAYVRIAQLIHRIWVSRYPEA